MLVLSLLLRREVLLRAVRGCDRELLREEQVAGVAVTRVDNIALLSQCLYILQ